MPNTIECRGYSFLESEVAFMTAALWDMVELTHIKRDQYSAQRYVDEVMKPQFAYYTRREFLALTHVGRKACQEINVALQSDFNTIFEYIALSEGNSDA